MMEITIKMTPQQEARLRQKASDSSMSLLYYVKCKLGITDPNLTKGQETARDLMEMFESWREEDAKLSPDELAQIDAQWKEVDKNIRENGVICRVPDLG